jgi:hypothetical protein
VKRAASGDRGCLPDVQALLADPDAGLSPARLRAVNVLAGAESDGAEVAGCGSDAVAEWLQDDPEFIAGLNRAK